MLLYVIFHSCWASCNLFQSKLKHVIENDVSVQLFEIESAMLPLTCIMSGLCACSENRADGGAEGRVSIVNDDLS